MRNRFHSKATLIAVLGTLTPVAAQQPSPGATLDERVTKLESDVASIETRVDVQSARPSDFGGESGRAVAARVDALERTLQRLQTDVQRIERLADTAMREAAQARRDASAAQSAARDAALRSR